MRAHKSDVYIPQAYYFTHYLFYVLLLLLSVLKGGRIFDIKFSSSLIVRWPFPSVPILSFLLYQLVSSSSLQFSRMTSCNRWFLLIRTCQIQLASLRRTAIEKCNARYDYYKMEYASYCYSFMLSTKHIIDVVQATWLSLYNLWGLDQFQIAIEANETHGGPTQILLCLDH